MGKKGERGEAKSAETEREREREKERDEEREKEREEREKSISLDPPCSRRNTKLRGQAWVQYCKAKILHRWRREFRHKRIVCCCFLSRFFTRWHRRAAESAREKRLESTALGHYYESKLRRAFRELRKFRDGESLFPSLYLCTSLCVYLYLYLYLYLSISLSLSLSLSFSLYLSLCQSNASPPTVYILKLCLTSHRLTVNLRHQSPISLCAAADFQSPPTLPKVVARMEDGNAQP